MNILVVSNYYPPYVKGGYELGCFQIVEALQKRGHSCHVLCGKKTTKSLFGNVLNVWSVHKDLADDKNDLLVYRDLEMVQLHLNHPIRRKFYVLYWELHNRRIVRSLIKNIKPDLIYVWNPMDTSVSVLSELLKSKIPMVYYFFDLWFEFLNRYDLNLAIMQHPVSPWARFWFWGKKQLLRQLNLTPLGRLPEIHGQFCSNMVLDHCRQMYQNTLLSSEIIYFGLTIEDYVFIPNRSLPAIPRILFTGRLRSEKGFDRCLQSLKILFLRGYSFLFTAIGSQSPEEVLHWRAYAEELGIASMVDIRPFIPQKELKRQYSEYDILIFSSYWEEPYGFVPLEAMVSGAVVVASGAGGSIDNCLDGYNSLVYRNHDPIACADCLEKLFNSPELYQRLRNNGRTFVCTQRIFSVTVDKIEQSLKRRITLQ